jgi:hypothetical protein
MDRITAIRRSLAAFVCGIFGFMPVIGIIPAACALTHWWAVRSKYRDQWNPASAYLRTGLAFALFGILSTTLLVAVIALAIINA